MGKVARHAMLLLAFAAIAAAGDDWPMAFHDSQHSGRSAEVVPPPLTLAWTWKDTIAYDNDPKWNRIPNPWLPILYQDRLYIQGGMNANRLFALDPATGKVLWEADNPGYTTNGTSLFQFANYPAAVKGRVLNASTDFTASVDAATGGDQHVVYNTNGGRPNGGTALWNGLGIFQFVETDNGFEDIRLVRDAVKFSVVGSYVAPDRTTTFSDFGFRVPAVDGNVVYANQLGQLVAWDPASTTNLWQWGTRNFGASPAVWNHILFFYASSRSTLVAIPAAAMSVSANSLSAIPLLWSAAVPGANSPIASDGVVYVGSSDRNFYALDAQTGAVKWKLATGAGFTPLQIAAISGSVIYVPGADGVLYALNKDTGQELWRYTGSAPFGPVVIGGGRVVVSDTAFTLYCFQAAGAALGPAVTGFSPARVTNTPATIIGLTGLGFTGATAVQLDDAARTALTGFTVTGDTAITGAAIPPGVAPGRYRVSVTTPVGHSVDGPEVEVLSAGSFFRSFVGLSQGPIEHGTDLPFQRHLARFSDGTLMAAFSGRELDQAHNATFFMPYVLSRDGGKTWTTPIPLDPGGSNGYVRWAASFGISAAPPDQVHAVFQQWPSFQQTFYPYQYDGTDFLSAAAKPSFISGGPTYPGPSVTDSAGKVWVAYAVGNEVYSSYSSDGGVTWTQTPKLNKAAAAPPAMTVFNGMPFVVYTENGVLVSSAWNGTQWSAPQSLPGAISKVETNLSLATTADGRLHVAAGSSAGLRYLNFDGAAWTAVTALDAAGTMPSLTTNGADLWCFYVTATNNIAYRRLRSDATVWDAAVPVTNDALINSRPATLPLSPDNTVPVLWTVGAALPYEIHSAVIPVQSPAAALESRVYAAPRVVSGAQGRLVASVVGGQPPYSFAWPDAPAGSSLSGATSASPTVAFTRAGTYRFPVTVRDAAGATSTAFADISVAQAATTVTINAPGAPMAANLPYPFTATVADQFGSSMLLPPPVTWSLAAGGPRGNIDANGNFAASQAGDFKIAATLPGGASASVTVTVAPAGTLPPVLSNIGPSAITLSSATIRWTTNDPSDSQVEYGFTNAYGSSSPLNSAMSTSHVVELMGLTPGKLYHYRVHSKNIGGKESVSDDATLTTQGAPGRKLGR